MSKILVVDDEQGIRDFLAIMLKKDGHEAVTAGNGADALRAVQAEIFDLVITDVKMPGKDGIEVLKTIKEISPETVVIMITAFATAETAVEAMKLGAYDYIIKPFKVDELKIIINNSLEKRHLRKRTFSSNGRLNPRPASRISSARAKRCRRCFLLSGRLLIPRARC